MRAPKGFILVAVAGAMGVAACAASLSDFSIGEGADGGAGSDTGGGSASSGASSSGAGEDSGTGSSGGSGSSSSSSSSSGDGAAVDAALETGAGDAAGADACAAIGTGAIGTLGCPCSTSAEHACNGNAQTVTLLCSGGTWASAGTCASGQLCDTQAGSNQGTCEPIDPNCTNANPGDDVCGSATTVVQCGPDLLTDSPVATCTSQACVGGACTGVCTPSATQCASAADGGVDGGAANGVETCAADGTWGTAVACVNSTCTAGVCSGSCSAGSVQCSGNAAVQSCVSGMWAAPTACVTQACVSGTCTGCLLWALGGIGVPAGTTVTASSTASGSSAANAIDGNLTTNWNSGGHSASLSLQFPTPQTITGINIAAGAKPASDETYTVKAAGSSTTIGSATQEIGGGSGGTVNVSVTPGTYAGITITIASPTSWIAIFEVSLLTAACP